MDDTPLDLPEIRALVGSFLSRSEIAICAQVCRAWRSTFSLLVWRDTVIHPCETHLRNFAPPPPPADLRANAHLIRSLAFEPRCSFRDIAALAEECRRLSHLRLTATAPPAPRRRRIRNTNWLSFELLEEYEILVDDIGENDNNSDDDGSSNATNARNSKTWSKLAALVSGNRDTLRSLEISLMFSPPTEIPTKEFWLSVAECFSPTLSPSYSSTRLTSLELSGREMQWSDLLLVWGAAGPHLETLKIIGCAIELDQESSPTEQTISLMEILPPTALRHLTLVNIRGITLLIQFQLFIAQSSRLKSLFWISRLLHPSGVPFPELEQEQSPGSHRWAELESVSFGHVKAPSGDPGSRIDSYVLERVGTGAGGKGSLQSLTLRSPEAGYQLARSLRPHFTSLRVLDMMRCPTVSGAMVQDILSSCPNLVTIKADVIHAQDIHLGKPWVCLGADSGYDREALQQIVFQRLGILTSLETMDLDRYFPLRSRTALGNVVPLDWRLEAGLSRLSGLKRLSSVSFLSDQTMNMSKSAVWWMLEQWPLASVRGRLGHKKADHKDIVKILKQSVISVA
ncbi:hypothetical protein BGZ70_009300 [Mortierella alpina]|uniref:F-box domain-containing protein n=1 Tax=Mortierella alpina TaxID=64518 RepID=A0A9P6M0N4_MORAP|nr:hypothetical protein BGZ70_009300 [Mortierella alpina]